MATYKLWYFETMGRGEPARLIFHFADVQFDDYRINKAKDWPKIKPTTVFGQLPLLEVDGKILAQSLAICRFLGNQFDMVGRTALESAECDMLGDGIQDFLESVKPWYYAKQPDKKEEIWQELRQTTFQTFFDRYAAILTKNGTNHLVGDKMTWVDLLFYHVTSIWGERLNRDLVEKHPIIIEFLREIENIPRIANYLAKRPYSIH